MQLSYWEKTEWLSGIDFTIIGSGITGLNCALALREKHPKSRILVLEKGILPQGASTKNAGFACFGSISELLDDLNTSTEEDMVKLVEKRWKGLQLLRKNLGDKKMDYRQYGGQELFLKGNPQFFEACLENIDRINGLLQPVFNEDVFTVKKNIFGFQGIQDRYIFTPFEGQINTGKMMQALLKLCSRKDIRILNATEVLDFKDTGNKVAVKTDRFEFSTEKLFIATNGFASNLLKEDVLPARAQVLVTKPLKNLKIKGTFHLEKGYYYFRNIQDRILFGGGRNLDISGETTIEFGETRIIQDRLEEILKTVILPGTSYEIDQRWSGIMGVGKHKDPIVKPLSGNVYCGVRLGGIGIAIGTWTGKELAALAD
ncbi:NAD(P)/FAD-dependent oxidoreductase [Sinomicrobium weinanense]|uniref:FAD-binding oxidoreductase n=1 Tax=Sinomicrobium weinanense TaxID=2842200 RepID=A0A926Q3D1_9FLAO|nr:FAD-dependent oxidoreductase [Sinomicrobium weinanense]MBC9795881.1 FAD-binding oxidoreductase [Sinomicrobium weinanense]MBU3125401.1 FAD-binding oxidoreductase [Sinomicrobium weinanense]